MNKYIIVIAIFLLSLSSLAQAQCIARPSCADMGYNKTATQCAGKDYLRCPFDTSAYFCDEIINVECDFEKYPLTSCPTGGVCSYYTCGGDARYKVDSCQSGYAQSGNTCVVCDFTGYTLSSCPTNGICDSKICGGVSKYKLNACKWRYVRNDELTSCVCDKKLIANYCPGDAICTSHTCDGIKGALMVGCSNPNVEFITPYNYGTVSNYGTYSVRCGVEDSWFASCPDYSTCERVGSIVVQYGGTNPSYKYEPYFAVTCDVGCILSGTKDNPKCVLDRNNYHPYSYQTDPETLGRVEWVHCSDGEGYKIRMCLSIATMSSDGSDCCDNMGVYTYSTCPTGSSCTPYPCGTGYIYKLN